MAAFDHTSGSWTEVDGARIYWEAHGEDTAPVLLFLHGGFGSIEDFNGVLSALKGRWRIIGIDSRGQGASTLGHAPLSYQRITRDVEQILASLQIKQLSVIGFSDGGVIALRLAAALGARIERLVLIGTPWQSASIEDNRELYEKVTGESWRKKFPETFKLYQRVNPEPDFFDALAKALVQMWLDTGASGMPDDAVRQIRSATLIVRGDDDHLVAAAIPSALAAVLEHAHYLSIPFAGHVAFDDGRAIFMAALEQFLSRPLPA